jgi:capsid protein
LALVLQSLNEIDRYRDSTQRKAVINSMLAMFVKKTQDKMGTSPLSGGAIRRGTDTTIDSAGTPRDFAAAEQIPGLVIQELQVGEEPQAFGAQGTDERFGAFEEAIIATVAWANEYPPEIMRLAFSSNYSASQAAINELKMYLNRVRTRFSESVCQPIYIEWLIAATLAQKLTAPGLLDSWRDSAQYDTFGAWTASDWAGQIKPAVDLNKLITGYEKALDAGLITRQRAARELFGLRYSKIIKQLATENQMLADAREPLLDAEADAKREAVQTEPVDIDKEDDDDETEKPKGLLHVAS